MNGLHHLLNKLIRTASGRYRYRAAILGTGFAFLLIFVAVQIQADYQQLLYGPANRDSIANFLVVNKVLTDRNLGATALSEQEIQDLQKQPFVETIGQLTPSRFKASIQSASDRFPFYTDIAFESVPQAFMDIDTTNWNWNAQSMYVPIVVPNMFLDFYNFQFSFSQNLPQLTREVVKMVGFTIQVYGKDGTRSFRGRVVGFSDRISSLLVPESFMQWANSHFGTQQTVQPSRIIIQTHDPGNPALVQYLRTHGLTTDSDKTRFSKYRQVVDLVAGISGITGLLMLAFALLVFTLFVQLTVHASRDEIRLLMQLGMSPQKLVSFLFWRFFPVHVYNILLSVGIVSLLQWLAARRLLAEQVTLSAWPSWQLAGVALFLLVLIGFMIYRTLRSSVVKARI